MARQQAIQSTHIPAELPVAGERPILRRQVAQPTGMNEVPPVVESVLRSSDRPLDQATRSDMEPRFGHDFSRVRVYADARSTPMIQRQVAPGSAGPVRATAVTRAEATSGLVVEDTATEIMPGQMRKSEFLAMARAEVCRAAEESLATVGRSTDGCPYLDYWFDYYSNKDSGHIERAIVRYAPEASGAITAGGYIPAIVERVRRGVENWVRTGELTDVPEDVPIELPTTDGLEPEAGVALTTDSVQFKGRHGDALWTGDPMAIQSRLGRGRALDGGVKARMESAFGANFSHVRTHTDATAVQLSRQLNARAFTVGEHVAFGSGEYRPGTPIGDALIAHELAHVAQQTFGAKTTTSQHGKTDPDLLEREADRSAIGAVVFAWTGAKMKAGDISANAVPRLRSGLMLQGCRASERSKTGGEEYHGVGGALHKYVYEPLQEDYSGWMEWGYNLSSEWGEEVPVLGHAAGSVVGFVPWVLGGAGKAVVGIPQFVTPKTQEEHFITVVTAGTGTPVVRVGTGIKYGYWWVRNLFKKSPKVEKEVAKHGTKVVNEVLEEAGERASTEIREVPARVSGKTTKVPTKGTAGSRRASVKGRARTSEGGPRGPKPLATQLTAAQREMVESLVEEHPGLHERTAAQAIRGAKSVAGRGTEGADVILENGSLREVFVYTGERTISWQSILSKLAQKPQLGASKEVYLQINHAGASKGTISRWAGEALKSGDVNLEGKHLRIFGPDGDTWWWGTF